MRTGARQKIQLADLIQNLQLQLEDLSGNPRILKSTVRDIHTLTKLAQSPFQANSTLLRKKAAQRQKIHKQSERSAAELQQLFANQPGANCQIAYNIQMLTSPPILKNKAKLIQELKLSFLESYGVELNEWNSFLKPDLGMLAIRIPQSDAEIIIGMTQEQGKASLQWTVFEATIGGQRNLRFLQFVRGYIKWSKEHAEQWHSYVIKNIKMILDNTQAITIFIELNKALKDSQSSQLGYGEQKIGCLFQCDNGLNNKATWNFRLQEQNHESQLTLKLQEEQVLQLIIRGKLTKGRMHLSSLLGDGTPIQLQSSWSQLPSYFSFIKFPELFYTYQNYINSLYTKNASLLTQSHHLLIKTLGTNWLPKGFNQQDKRAPKDGLWIHVSIENGFFLQVEEDGRLISQMCDKNFISQLLSKGMTLHDLVRHLKLLEKVKIENDLFEFKTYEIKAEKLGSNNKCFIKYEFRSQKFPSNQKYSRTNRFQEHIMQPESNNYVNAILNVRVSFDFTEVHFSSWKYNEGQKSQTEKKHYLNEDWKKYEQGRQKGEKLSCNQLGEAISYYCRCYLIERIRYGLFNEEFRKANPMQFK